ncbi:hypothetical protein TRICI_004131 [Trichomonascus ciferrii]|uniref:GrpE protein homolog n=1 Tax=Trichomonascus ciferrii TaxID=44093 RepID=A0A642V7X1_9ASCO|nr:hypothetical protein TRICI_004131 [Trichomonascus ciferrii]
MLRRVISQATAARPAALRPRVVPSARPVAFRMGAVRLYSEKPAAENGEGAAAAEETKEAKPAEEEAVEDEATQWKKKYEAKDKDLAQMRERYQRAVADFQNLQKSTEKTVQNAKDFALQKFAKDLLESLDNFDRALSAVPEEKRADADNHKELADLYAGIKMTQDVFEKTLSKHGLVKVNPVDEKFDPNVHEATFEIPQPDKEPGTIFHVQQPGYSLNNRVIRAAKVGVVKGDE